MVASLPWLLPALPLCCRLRHVLHAADSWLLRLRGNQLIATVGNTYCNCGDAAREGLSEAYVAEEMLKFKKSAWSSFAEWLTTKVIGTAQKSPIPPVAVSMVHACMAFLGASQGQPIREALPQAWHAVAATCSFLLEQYSV